MQISAAFESNYSNIICNPNVGVKQKGRVNTVMGTKGNLNPKAEPPRKLNDLERQRHFAKKNR
ncbi:MAG: hypothetical protein HQL32_11705 [Planctomycetes bacterium]|nr:hypothetical protein [Planctomycetota bacterium]